MSIDRQQTAGRQRRAEGIKENRDIFAAAEIRNDIKTFLGDKYDIVLKNYLTWARHGDPVWAEAVHVNLMAQMAPGQNLTDKDFHQEYIRLLNRSAQAWISKALGIEKDFLKINDSPPMRGEKLEKLPSELLEAVMGAISELCGEQGRYLVVDLANRMIMLEGGKASSAIKRFEQQYPGYGIRIIKRLKKDSEPRWVVQVVIKDSNKTFTHAIDTDESVAVSEVLRLAVEKIEKLRLDKQNEDQ